MGVVAVAAYVLHHALLLCPVCWDVASIREGGGGGGRPRPGTPLLGSPPLLLLSEYCGEFPLLRWFNILLVICGTVEDEW